MSLSLQSREPSVIGRTSTEKLGLFSFYSSDFVGKAVAERGSTFRRPGAVAFTAKKSGKMQPSRASALALVSLTLALTLNLAKAAGSEDLSTEFKEWQEFKEFQEFRAWKHRHGEQVSARARSFFGPDNEDRYPRKKQERWFKKNAETKDPPPIDQAALMARYIVNQAGWTSVATVSSRKDTENYPFVNLISFSDGPLGNGTGIPYLFLTPLDFTAQDVFKDNRATLMMSLAQGRYCEHKNYDPMDPRCARVVLTGKIKELKEDNPEFPTARNAVYGRHPWLAHMPADHHFFFAKLKIGTIAVLDTFGGPKYVTINNYLNPPNPNLLTKSFESYHQIVKSDLDIIRNFEDPSERDSSRKLEHPMTFSV